MTSTPSSEKPGARKRGTGAPAPADQALDGRKAKILTAVVAEHIESGQPVGSAHLSAATGLGVSSATIRNEMSVLEREGYLTHPHTSAGRIPTDRGYRFFVDALAQSRGGAALTEPKVHQVRQFFDGARSELEQLLTETTRLLAGLTDYAAVVVAPPAEVATVRSVQIVSLGHSGSRVGTTLGLVVVVLSNGVVQKSTVDLSSDVSETQLGAASAHLTTQLVGRPLRAVGAHPGQAPILRATDPQIEAIAETALASIETTFTGESEPGAVYMNGASRMIGAFDTVDTVRRVLGVLEEQITVVSLLREALERSSAVSIGTEHGVDVAFESLLTCSVVVAPYLVDGKSVGTIGVLGPTRMDYPQAMAAVTAVSEGLNERLSER